MSQLPRNIPWYYRLLGKFLRLFFRLLYHEMAWTYDAVAAIVSLGRWKGWVMEVLPRVHGGKVLEVGHGPGHLQVALLQNGIQIFGLDESRQMSRQASHRIRKSGFTPRLTNGLAQSMPYSSGAFDQVIATFPSEYIVASNALSEIHRVLAPGGELIALPLAWITGKTWLERLAAWLFRVTGEAPDIAAIAKSKRFTIPFEKAGFHVETEFVQLPGSTILFLHAYRLPLPSASG